MVDLFREVQKDILYVKIINELRNLKYNYVKQ